jgi:hypothetical protein
MNLPVSDLLARFRVAQTLRQPLESLWQECADYTLPYRRNTGTGTVQMKNAKLFDGTAADAIDQLAASLLAQLTPPFSSWIAVGPGPSANARDIERLSPVLREMNAVLQGHFDRSNFAVEMHQAFLDLVIFGTACLRFDEGEPGEASAFHFTAQPLNAVHFLDSARGNLDAAFSRISLSGEDVLARFPNAAEKIDAKASADTRYNILYAAIPHPQGGSILSFILNPEDGNPFLLEQMRVPTSPFIAFRWQKASGDIYGRSPVMKTLPDIKTANKVVELILKNASISVTGIWLADDDGVLNPANIKLVPGAIIPKAVGSAGLTPLKMPGDFNVSQLVLSDLRQKISQALLGDRLATNSKRMTATEILERQNDIAQSLGATYGRLQGELLTPLAMRALSILRSRGEIADIPVDGRLLTLEYRSPLARAQSRRDVEATLGWVQTAQQYGDIAMQSIDVPSMLQYLARQVGVPPHLIKADALT